jgi:hypothetical protein
MAKETYNMAPAGLRCANACLCLLCGARCAVLGVLSCPVPCRAARVGPRVLPSMVSGCRLMACAAVSCDWDAQESEAWSASASNAQGGSSRSGSSGDEAHDPTSGRGLVPPDVLSASTTVTSAPSSAQVTASALRDAASQGVRRRHQSAVPASADKERPESQE